MAWYAGWVALVVALVALPVVVYATHGHTTVTTDPLVPSATPTPSPTTVAASGDEPLCANVWQKGKTLPAHYAGCQSSGTLTPALYLIGHQCLVVYDKRLVAPPGGTVRPLTTAVRRVSSSSDAPSTCAGTSRG